MNANQVVIVMDRDGAETLTGKTGKHSSDCAGPGWDCDCGAANEGRARMRRGRAALRAALDRDPDELDPVVRATILKAEHEWIRGAIEKRKLKDPPDEYRIGFNEGLQEALDLIQPDLSALRAIEGASDEG